MKEGIDHVPEFRHSSARSTEADFPVLGLLSYLLSTGGPKMLRMKQHALD